jgi:hypothetical protein
MMMGFLSIIKGFKARFRRTWRAWRGFPGSRTWDELSPAEQADIKRRMALTWEQINKEYEDSLISKLKDEVEEQVNELDDSFRGGNGQD